MEGEGARGCNAAGHQHRAAPGPPLRPSPHGHHHLPRPAASSLLAPARRPPHRTSYRAPCPLPGRLGGGGDPHNTGARAEGWGESEAARRTPLPPASLFRGEGSERDLPRPSPPPPPPPPHTPTARAPVAARATERLAPARVLLARSARAPLPPPRARARAPSPHSSGFRAGEVRLASAPPNQRSRRCRPLPSPCAPARGPGLRAARQPGRGLRRAP